MNFVSDAFFAFASTFGFAVLFNIPRRYLVLASFCGMFGWLAYLFVFSITENAIIASFIGGITVGITGEFMARLKKQPATLFVVPGIIPLVPGYGLYYTMSEILQRDYTNAVSVGFEAALVAVSIASAIIIATALGRVLKEWLKG